MNEESKSLLLKRPINLKVIVTQRWKEEVQQQLQSQINKYDEQLQQLENQGQSAIAQVTQQGSNPSDPQVQQQLRNVQNQVNQQKSKVTEQKNQSLQQLQQVQLLEEGQEVGQGQMDSFIRIQVGDNLVKKMNAEVVIKDGIVQEIRGDI
ncbi:YlqD family protein [Euhalothece natronophila]|nr:YlqD family protein [Euhalothece natronophila]